MLYLFFRMRRTYFLLILWGKSVASVQQATADSTFDALTSFCLTSCSILMAAFLAATIKKWKSRVWERVLLVAEVF